MPFTPRYLAVGALVVAAAVVGVVPAHADVDTDFAAQLHIDGIYGPRDYDAWLAKIACQRLGPVDATAFDSARFVSINLPRVTTTEQS